MKKRMAVRYGRAIETLDRNQQWLAIVQSFDGYFPLWSKK
jgi:hypothetical protein